MKPIMNLDEVEIKSHEGGPFSGKYGVISSLIGAQKLGYNLTICPPGKSVCPFHNHREQEEMFFIIEGQGVVRFGDKEYPLRQHDILACPPGGPEVAHRITNTGKTDLKYLSLSTKDHTEVCEYPDSKKIGIFVGDWPKMEIRLIVKADQGVDYLEGENK